MLTMLMYGPTAFTLACFGIWILKRESSVEIRAVGYLLAALGTALTVGAFVRWLISLLSLMTRLL